MYQSSDPYARSLIALDPSATLRARAANSYLRVLVGQSLIMATDAENQQNDVFEEGMDSSNVRTVHRLRANSTIMRVKKVLGQSSHAIKLSLRVEPG